jgi:hypothetical protein
LGLSVNDLFDRADAAATPLMPEEIRGLIPASIAYRSELNAAEQENIVRAQEWALGREVPHQRAQYRHRLLADSRGATPVAGRRQSLD